MITYIDRHRDQFGVERICRILGSTVGGFITARGYRAFKSRPPSNRQVRDEQLIDELRRLHTENYSVYGVRKMQQVMRRHGWVIGRDQTARLMKTAGLRGVQRGKPVHTTHPDPAADARPDLVGRRFVADRPRQLWVVDLTYVRTWAGFAYTAFVTDVYSRRIVGWNVAATLRTDNPLEAFEHAVW